MAYETIICVIVPLFRWLVGNEIDWIMDKVKIRRTNWILHKKPGMMHTSGS